MKRDEMKALGARCDECALGKRDVAVFGSDVRAGATFDVVVDYGRDVDVREKRLLSKAAGMRFAEALPMDARYSLHAAVACAPLTGSMDGVLEELQKTNEARRRSGLELLPSPVECCRPRLLKALKTSNVVTLGAQAFEALTGRPVDVMDVRGGPLELNGRKILPSIHPWLVHKAPIWKRALSGDLEKALRWFDGGRRWPEARRQINPTASQLRAFLGGPGPFAVDVETTLDELERCRLKCVGIATQDAAVLIQYLSVRLTRAGYRDEDRPEIDALLKAFLADPEKLKVGHNAVAFDVAVLKGHLGVEMSPVLDTLLLHRLVAPDEHHGLGYVGSIYTDAPSWKAEHRQAGAQTDAELASYCMQDCVVTARLLEPLVKEVEGLGLDEAARHDHRVQTEFRRMREVGVPVAPIDPERERLTAEIARLDRVLAGTGINPNSGPQLKRLLFETWGLTPQKVGSTGQPSVELAALRVLRRQVTDDRAKVFDALLARQRARAVLRTLSEVEARDGRVRVDWSVRADGWPDGLERLVEAPSGRVLVTARLLQPRLRLVTRLAGLARYRELFSQRADIYIETAAAMLGEKVRLLTGAARQETRRLAYDVASAALYGASDERVFESVTTLSRADGTLRYPSLTLRLIASMRRKWLETVPELPRWWEECLEKYARKGAAVDPVQGRRREGIGGHEAIRWAVDTAVTVQVQEVLLRAEGLTPVALIGETLVVEVDADETQRASWLLQEACAAEAEMSVRQKFIDG